MKNGNHNTLLLINTRLAYLIRLIANRHLTRIVVIICCSLGMSACGTSEDDAQKSQEKVVSAGEKIYNKSCKVCHAQGINGAPILGNKKMWSDRASKGKSVLVEHASQGFGLMPAKGGNADLTDEEIALVVDFMLSSLK